MSAINANQIRVLHLINRVEAARYDILCSRAFLKTAQGALRANQSQSDECEYLAVIREVSENIRQVQNLLTLLEDVVCGLEYGKKMLIELNDRMPME